MSKKFGLGKGLNALIPEDTVILEPKKGKDKNDDNGYVVEFTSVDKDRNMIVGIDDLIQFSDRYKFGEEIKLK